MQRPEELFESPDYEDGEEVQGIALDEKEQHVSDSIITESLRPVLAFQTFGGNLYDPKAEPEKTVSVYSSATPATFESPLQKFKRLKQELSLFQAELDDMQSDAPDSNDTIPLITKDIKNELTTLWSELEARKAEKSGVFQETLSSEALSTDVLIKELQRFQAMQQGDSELADKEVGKATYSLYAGLNPDGPNLASLAQRIARIENVLGKPPDKGLSYPNMTTAVSHLVKNLQLLDQEKLASVLTKVKQLNTELGALEKSSNKEKSEQERPTEKELATQAQTERVNKMFNTMKNWDRAAGDLPVLVERLKKLKDVHDAGAGMTDKINRLEQQQEQISKLLQEDKELLKKASESLAENSKKMHENVVALDRRMKSLMDRLSNRS